MMEWKEVRLGDFMLFNPTRSLKKNTVAKKVTMDKLIPHSKKIVDYSLEPYNGGAKFINGDTIMARITPCLENGKHAYVSFLDEGEVGYGSTEYIVMRGIENVSDNEFVYYLSKTPYFKNIAVKSMVGSSGRQRAQVDVLEELIVKVPPLPLQRRISSILTSLDRKIELNHSLCQKLEEMASTLFRAWFIDFLPFKNQELIDSPLGRIPKGWKVGTLGEIASINPKRSLKKGAKVTYLDMKNMPTNGSFPLSVEEKEYNGGMKFQNGDTLMARITPCLENGKVAYVNFLNDSEIGFGSTEYIVMTNKEDIFPELLYFLCRFPNFVQYATKNMNGSSGRQRVSGETISNYQLAIAPKEIYDELRPAFQGIMNQIRVLGLETKRLTSLRDTLLPRLMSGELEL